jgi:hypothetical protein
MTADEEKPAAADGAPPRMQFSLGTLLLLPVVAGCALAVLFTKPPNVAAAELFVIAFLLPAALTGGIVYGKGYTRAFCIGALFPVGVLFCLCTIEFIGMLSPPAWDFDVKSLFTLQCLFGGGWLAAIICGCLCIGIRWLSLRPAVADGSIRQHGWGRAIFVLLLVLLVLSGPIVGRIGISLGWWKLDAQSPNPYSSPTIGAPNPYSTATGYPSSATPYSTPAPSGVGASNPNGPGYDH